MQFTPVEPTNDYIEAVRSHFDKIPNKLKDIVSHVIGGESFIFKKEEEYESWGERYYSLYEGKYEKFEPFMRLYFTPYQIIDTLAPKIEKAYEKSNGDEDLFLITLIAMLFRIQQNTHGITSAWKILKFYDSEGEDKTNISPPSWLLSLFKAINPNRFPEALTKYFKNNKSGSNYFGTLLYILNQAKLSVQGNPINIYKFIDKEILTGKRVASGRVYSDPSTIEFWCKHSTIVDERLEEINCEIPFHVGIRLHREEREGRLVIDATRFLLLNIFKGLRSGEISEESPYLTAGRAFQPVISIIEMQIGKISLDNPIKKGVLPSNSILFITPVLQKWSSFLSEAIRKEMFEKPIRTAKWNMVYWMKIFPELNNFPAQTFPEDEITLLKDLAYREWGEFRKKITSKAFRIQYESDNMHERQVLFDALKFSLIFLQYLNGTWKGIKPILLAIRHIPVKTVASDLRYWNEQKKTKVPEPWNFLPKRFAWQIHNIEWEEKEDPELKSLRTNFAKYLLSRLKTNNDKLVEPNPIWRYFYIRALRELKINPRGKSHNLLNWVSKNDPDNQVRNAAKIAAKELRHQQWAPGYSPRRMIFSAFWWLRQAHLIYINQECGVKDAVIDPDGAQRTRAKEVRYVQMNI